MSCNSNAESVAANLQSVRDMIAQHVKDNNRVEGSVRLVAVSKTKPVELLMEAYEAGQRRFGENYAQELISKAEELPSDVEWHFIGPLQSNKAASLVKHVFPKLKCIETVSTIKLATKLNNAMQEMVAGKEGGENITVANNNKLSIFLQVNTSDEDSKSGVSSTDVIALATEISKSCPFLSIDGLMTIGAPGDYSCFDSLVECRAAVAEALGMSKEEGELKLELSMGMSGDYSEAIKRGSTNVRIGSTIFGDRDYSSSFKK